MNSIINSGKDREGKEILLDLQKQNLNLILLVGQTGTGKGIFHFNLYRQLLLQNSPEELGFMLIDNTQVDFNRFHPAYLLRLGKQREDAFEILASIQEELRKRNSGESDNKKAIFVHIEECDQFAQDPVKTEAFFKEFIRLKQGSNIYLVYSTSRPSKAMLPDWLIESTDLKVVFGLANKENCQRVLGSDLPLSFSKRGERVLAMKDVSHVCLPFMEDEIAGDEEYVNVGNSSLSVDDYYNKAWNLVTESERASIAFLQRKLGIRYTIAIGLLEKLEQNGVIRQKEGSHTQYELKTTENKTANIYLDIDGVLLANENNLALHAKEFLFRVLEKYPDTTYWLTTHCQGDSETPIEHVGHLFDAETVSLMRKIKPTRWKVAKTEAIDFTQPFLWFDDDCFPDERAVLNSHGVFDNWIEIDLSKNENQLKKFIESFPIPIQLVFEENQ